MKNFLAKFNFKLTNLHLFLILVGVLILASLGFSVKEYFESKIDTSDRDNKGDRVNEALEKGSNTDPFNNAKKNASNEDKNFESMIADLEDVVIPDRKNRRHHHDKQGNHWPHKKTQGDMTNGSKEDKNSMDKEQDNNDTMSASSDSGLLSTFSNNNNGVDMSKYILKSEVVPPVCPKCPDAKSCPRPIPCPPCKPCGRCPEPSFGCIKVPNYNSLSMSNVGGRLPVPRLNSFAQFN